MTDVADGRPGEEGVILAHFDEVGEAFLGGGDVLVPVSPAIGEEVPEHPDRDGE
jgi:hypothetical protein